MDFSDLSTMSHKDLRVMCINLGIPAARSKVQAVKDIVVCFREYEAYRRDKVDVYQRVMQLGDSGKEGTTFLVRVKGGGEYAMKTFRKKKSIVTLSREADLQRRGASQGISPEVRDVDLVSKTLVMDKMDHHLVDVIRKQGGLSMNHQRQIIGIYMKLDAVGVFHGDANMMNYMLKRGKVYIIDYGMAREITPSLVYKLGTSTPNINIMTLGLVLKLRSMGCGWSSYKYLVKHLSKDQLEKFGIEEP